MFLTVITPTFNSEKFIKRHINSLNKQKCIFQQIIIDNCSTDQTIKIIKENAHYPFKIIQKKDKGIYDAMNKGVKYAKGDFYLFLNSDDWLPENILNFVLGEIKKNPGYDIYYGNSKFYNNDQFKFFQKSNIAKMLKYNSMSHQAIYYSRHVFVKNKYDISYQIAADYDLNIKLLKLKYKFYYINNFLSCNQIGGKSSNLLLSFSEFSNIQLKNNGLIAYLNILLEYKHKIFIIFFKRIYEKLFS